jgi:SAM-dependent methyltransferase
VQTLCELCGRGGPKSELYPGQSIVRCPGCGLISYDAAVAPAELYGKDYFAGGEYLDYLGDRRIIQRNFAGRIRELRRLAPRGRLLEIGSAYGFFLDLARRHWRVKGFDISAEAVAHTRDVLRLEAFEAGDFLDLPDELERYDVICLWDTIEHLPRPVRHIEKAARWLKPGGILAMTTGDAGSALARLRGERWRQIHPPTHLYYFSTATLSEAVARAGLEVCLRSHVGYWRSAKAMLYGVLMLGRRRFPRLYALATMGGRLDFPVYLNLYDILLLIARKPTLGTASPLPGESGQRAARSSPS